MPEPAAAASVPAGARVRARPHGYQYKAKDRVPLDLDPPELQGVPDFLVGPLEKLQSSLGHTVYVVEGIVVDPETIELVENGTE